MPITNNPKNINIWGSKPKKVTSKPLVLPNVVIPIYEIASGTDAPGSALVIIMISSNCFSVIHLCLLTASFFMIGKTAFPPPKLINETLMINQKTFQKLTFDCIFLTLFFFTMLNNTTNFYFQLDW